MVSNADLAKENKGFPFLYKRPWTNPSCFEREKELSQATRSYKKYKPETFIRDHLKAPWRIIETFEDVDDCLHAFHQLFEQILDQHAPVRKVKIRCCPNPFITPENEYATWWEQEIKGRTGSKILTGGDSGIINERLNVKSESRKRVIVRDQIANN